MTFEDDFDQQSNEIPLYFLWDKKNYIVLQGVTYCASILYDKEGDGNLVKYKEKINY